MEGTILPVYVENISTRKDKTVKITLSTQELTPEKAGQLFGFMNQLIVAYLKYADINQDEIDLVDTIDPEFGGKTQSQRMRNTLYILFQQNNEGFKDFNSYYSNKTEKFIKYLKSKIES
jgi:hypothetical protein